MADHRQVINSDNQQANTNIKAANSCGAVVNHNPNPNPSHYPYSNLATNDNHLLHTNDQYSIYDNSVHDNSSITNCSLMDPNTSPSYINPNPNPNSICSSINTNENPNFFGYGGSAQNQSIWSELYYQACSQDSIRQHQQQLQPCSSFPSPVDPQAPAGFPKQETVYSNQKFHRTFMADHGPHLINSYNNMRNHDRPNSRNHSEYIQSSHRLINTHSAQQNNHRASSSGANYSVNYCNTNYILPSLASGNYEHLVRDMDQYIDVKPSVINDHGFVANPSSVFKVSDGLVTNHREGNLITDKKSSVMDPFSSINNYDYRKSGVISMGQNNQTVGLKRSRQQMDRQNINIREAAATPSESVITTQVPKPKTQAPKKRKTMQKKVISVPATGGPDKPPGECIPSDSWAWRKYGQKPIKGSPYPRSYYRCSSLKGCTARKQVERNPSDPMMIIVTYTSDHSHSSNNPSSAVKKEGDQDQIKKDEEEEEEEEDQNNLEEDDPDADIEEDQSSSTEQLTDQAKQSDHGLIQIIKEEENGISSASINDQSSEDSIDAAETLPGDTNGKCSVANDNILQMIKSEIKNEIKEGQSDIIKGGAEELEDAHHNHQHQDFMNNNELAYGEHDVGQSSRTLGDDEFDFSTLDEFSEFNYQLILDYHQAPNHGLDSSFDHLFMAPNWSNQL